MYRSASSPSIRSLFTPLPNTGTPTPLSPHPHNPRPPLQTGPSLGRLVDEKIIGLSVGRARLCCHTARHYAPCPPLTARHYAPLPPLTARHYAPLPPLTARHYAPCQPLTARHYAPLPPLTARHYARPAAPYRSAPRRAPKRTATAGGRGQGAAGEVKGSSHLERRNAGRCVTVPHCLGLVGALGV